MAMRAFCRRQIQYAALRQARNGSPKTSVMRNASVNAVVSRTAAMSVAPRSVVAGERAMRQRKGGEPGRGRPRRKRETGEKRAIQEQLAPKRQIRSTRKEDRVDAPRR